MEGQSVVYHQVSQHLKISLYEALNQQPQLFDTHAEYLLRKTKDGTDLILLDESFQNIQSIVHLPSPVQPHCLTIIHLDSCTIALCAVGDTVILTTIFVESETQRQTISVALQHQERFIFISNAISFKHCHLVIALTTKGQFYLIIIKRSFVLSVSKLSNIGDISQRKGLWDWVSKKKERQYTHWNLYLFKIDKYERFVNLLVIRDNLITLHLVELQLQTNQSTIFLVNRQKEIQKALEPWRVRQSFIVNQDCESFRQINVFLALERHGTVSISKLQVLNQPQRLFHLTNLLEDISCVDFKCLVAGDSIYYLNYSPKHQRYEFFKNKIEWLEISQNLRIIDENPCMTFKQRPMLKCRNEQVIIISSQGISLMGKQEEESDFSLDQLRWLAYKDTLNGIYQKKIQSLDSQDLGSLSRMLCQKQTKLVCWIKEQCPGLKEQDIHVMQIFGVEIVGVAVVRAIADYYLPTNFQGKQALLSLSQLFEASACGQTSITISLLSSLAEKDYSQLFLYLVKEVKKFGSQHFYLFGARTIFQEPFQILANRQQQNQGDTSIFQDIVSEIACFGVVEKKHLQLLQDKPEAIKRIILSNHLNKFLIECLLNSHSLLTGSDLSQYLRQLKVISSSSLSSFVCQLLQGFRQRVELASEIGLQFLSILIQGLVSFHEDLFYDIDRFLPGLNILLLLKQGRRRKLLELLAINVYFQELKNKPLLYLLIQDILKQQSQLKQHIALLSEVFFKDYQNNSKKKQREGLTVSGDQYQQEHMLESLPRKKIKL